MSDWKKFQEKMKNKRLKKGKKEQGSVKTECETIVVQRLSAEVAGKAQKYTRVGARVFVPFEEYGELTIENVRDACIKHYGIDKESTLCDVLAGEQGPSCFSIKQLPSFKVIHVRFVEKADVEIVEPDTLPKRRKVLKTDSPSSAPSTSSPTKQSDPSPSKFVPRSLSVVDILKLGKVINKNTTSVLIYHFSLADMVWSKLQTAVDFTIEPEPFGVGGFRQAFHATSDHKDFKNTKWVVKRYLPKAIKDITETNQTLEEHTKKVVQMHYLARNLTAKMNEELMKDDNSTFFGETLCYKKIFLGKIGEEEYVTVEEFIEGTFDKYINNDGEIYEKGSEITQKAECLVHYSFERSEKEVMILDIQGCGCNLFDPEICSKDIVLGEKVMFCTGNLSTVAMNNFIQNHKCNFYCKLLNLSSL